MTGTTVGNKTDNVELGVEDVRRVASSAPGPIRPTKVFEERDQSVNYDTDGCDTDLEERGTGDHDDVVLEKVLNGGAGAMR